MKVKIHSFNLNLWSILVFLFIVTIFLGSAITFKFNIYPLRVVVPFIFLLITIYIYSTSIQRKEIKIKSIIFFTLVFYCIYFLNTILVSLYSALALKLYVIDFNDLINFIFLFLYVLCLVFLLNSNRDRFMRIAIKAMLIMYIVYTIIALFEISTGFHFKMSAINFRPSYVRFTPTVFYTNPNDFSAIFTMMFIFLMNFYISREKKKNNYLLILISLLHLFILIKTSSRLNLIVFIFYLIVIWPKFFIKFSFFSLFVILISHDFIKHKIGIYDSTIFEYFTNIFNFNLSNSGRFHLYKSSFLSLKQNFGLGWGINASHFFYESLNIEKLGNLVNPHSNLLEILINSGVIVFLLYIFIIVLLINKFLKLKDYKNVFQVLFYQIILFSSSSSLFLWPSYLFFILYIGLSLGNNNSIKYI